MSLVPDYENSSSSSSSLSSDESYEESEEVSQLADKPKAKLPTPNFMNATPTVTASSVFKNPFTEAEHAKEAILQRHVKMVDTKDVAVINGRKICWNYRKGRCRFGHNCKFAHDSDIQKTKEELQIEREQSMERAVVCQSQKLPEPTHDELEKIQSETLATSERRKRAGLTQGLVPGKKVMKNFRNQKT